MPDLEAGLGWLKPIYPSTVADEEPRKKSSFEPQNMQF